MLANQDLRKTAKEKGVCLWQIAEKKGVSEPTITRLFRRELPQEQKQAILNIVDEISKENMKQGDNNGK